MAMSKEADSLFLDDEGLNFFGWQSQAEIHLDAAGLGMYYASVIKFKKKSFVHAATRLKAFGTILDDEEGKRCILWQDQTEADLLSDDDIKIRRTSPPPSSS
jgi:hypothetical protein